jgi:hypothetical protein
VVVGVHPCIKFIQECVEGIGQGANSSPEAVSVLQMACGTSGLAF